MKNGIARIFICIALLIALSCCDARPPLVMSVRGDRLKGESIVLTNNSDKILHPTKATLRRKNGDVYPFTPPDSIAPNDTVLISYLSLPLPGFTLVGVGDIITVECAGYNAGASITVDEIGPAQ